MDNKWKRTCKENVMYMFDSSYVVLCYGMLLVQSYKLILHRKKLRKSQKP
jgi:hypothetical protein